MGARLVAEHAAARATMAEADDAVGFPLTRLCFEGPEAELTRTEVCQPAILAVSVATWRALGPTSGIVPRWVAGHSLGEYTALVVAGALAFRDAVRLVRLRGRLMQSAVPDGVGTMAAIVGLEDARVAELCAAAAEGEIVSPANFNGAGQVVVAGHRAAVARVMVAAKAAGARVIALAVSAPFHCALMTPVAAALAQALAEVEVRTPAVPVVSNVEATLNADAARIRELLVTQVTAPVRWAESMRLLRALGCLRVIEVGPGQVLAKIAQRMKLGLASGSLEDGVGPAAEVRA
ncbi:MAG: ACP S-malonyltransferase [Deltaproteobacteria bacterium]|nr:ACP S-malonyltransferase [Deltaproteobacteria bacterium]